MKMERMRERRLRKMGMRDSEQWDSGTLEPTQNFYLLPHST